VDFVAGDTNSVLRATITKASDGLAQDLTATTVTLKYRISNGTLVTRVMTKLIPLTSGVAEYLFLTGELTAGTMVGEVEVLSNSGLLFTTVEPFIKVIRPRL